MARNKPEDTEQDSPHLDTWLKLNKALRELSEEDCWKLLAQERAGKRRVQYMLRIFSRANKLRTERERAEILNAPVLH